MRGEPDASSMRLAALPWTILLSAMPLAAQDDARGGHRELTLDVTVVGASVGYAAGAHPGRLVGVQLGIGGDWINRTLLGGEHFSENGGEQVFELLHLAAFVRLRATRWSKVDVGLRGAGFFHGNDLDDDIGIGFFGGLYAMPMFGNDRFSAGPRVMAGLFTEPGRVREIGLNVSPIVGRVTFPW